MHSLSSLAPRLLQLLAVALDQASELVLVDDSLLKLPGVLGDVGADLALRRAQLLDDVQLVRVLRVGAAFTSSELATDQHLAGAA